MDANVNDKIYRKVDEEKAICEHNKGWFFSFFVKVILLTF
jgi:hypothetical protein